VNKIMLVMLGLFAAVVSASPVSAEPYPGCPWVSGMVRSICSDTPPVPGLTPGFSMTEGVPGTWGPNGIYTPIQGGR
jgi:hypothetical protein